MTEADLDKWLAAYNKSWLLLRAKASSSTIILVNFAPRP